MSIFCSHVLELFCKECTILKLLGFPVDDKLDCLQDCQSRHTVLDII